ncbi:MAG: hypothetical protein ACREA0_11485 [bacterium]
MSDTSYVARVWIEDNGPTQKEYRNLPLRLIYQLLELLDHVNTLLRLLDRNKKKRRERED